MRFIDSTKLFKLHIPISESIRKFFILFVLFVLYLLKQFILIKGENDCEVFFFNFALLLSCCQGSGARRQESDIDSINHTFFKTYISPPFTAKSRE